MDLCRLNIKELFETFSVYEKLAHEIDRVCILADGVNDFFSFKQILGIFDSKATIFQFHDQLVFVLFSIDISYFEKQIKKQFEILHFEFYSIFPKKTVVNIITNEFKNIDQNAFNLCFYNNNLDFSFQNSQGIRILQTLPNKYLYKFDNYNDLVTCYMQLITSKSCWPIFAIPPQNSDMNTTILKHKNLCKCDYPLFSPIKSLYYFSFIEKVPQWPMRIFDAHDIYSINEVDDSQISHKHNKSFEIRTFLGFMNIFKCIQIFQYFIQISESQKNYYDVQLVDIDQASIPIINSDLFYLEVQSLFFDSSDLFQINCIDSFNFNGFTYYSFDSPEELWDAGEIIESTFDNDIFYKLKNFKFLEKEDLKFFFSDEIEETNLFYIILQMKCIEESKKRKRYLLSLLKDSVVMKTDLLCKLDNKFYAFIGFENEQKRKEVFLKLIKSKFSKPFKKYYPICEEDIVSNKANNMKENPIFQPKKKLLYIYFQENEKTKNSKSSNIARPLFGVSNVVDVQQDCFLRGNKNKYTFLGFSNQENMDKAIDYLSYKVNEIKEHVYRFHYDQITYKFTKKTQINNHCKCNNNTENIIKDNDINLSEIENVRNTNDDDITKNVTINVDDKLILNLNDYKKQKLIGKGSFGFVYLVENKQTHKKYAAKTKSEKASNFTDFLQEINFYQKFKYPPILSLHGISLTNFEKKNIPMIFLEYMPNGSLDNLISFEKNPILQSKKYIIIYGIAVAMKFLHSKGVFHRDLKPENILLDENYYPRVCDFGLSLITENHKKNKKGIIGTPKYMAPEIFKEKDCNSSKVDVYSFSLIAYELLTGKESFPNNKYHNIGKLKHDVIKGIRPDLSFIPDEEVLAFFQRCWSSEPSERPDFAEICEIFLKPKFKLVFQADELEILNYHYWFNDQLEDSKFNLHSLKQAEKNKDMNLMVEYGNRLFLGIGVQTDKEEAFRLFKIGADNKNTKSMYYLGIYLSDKEEKNKYLKMAADLEDEKAMNEYGEQLLEDQNEKALFYFKKAAQLGNEESFLHLGEMFSNGIGIENNKEKAAECFLKAADLGNVQAMYEYAHMLHLGDGIEEDYKKASEYYKLAAYYGNVKSMTNLGLMLKDGKLPIDLKESEFYLKMAAKLGDVDGMFHYGNLLCVLAITGECENEDESTKKFEKASKYFKKAADQGCIEAYTRYGMLYTKGFLKTNDLTEPLKYLKHAAHNGSTNGIVEYLSAMNNRPFDFNLSSETIMENCFENRKLVQTLFENGYDRAKAIALTSGFKVDPLLSFINNDHAIYNEYDYDELEEEEEEEESSNQNIKPTMKFLRKIGRRYGCSKDQISYFLRLFQHFVKNNNKTIDEVKIYHYKSFQYDPDKYYMYFSNFTIPELARDEIDKKFKSISIDYDCQSSLCHPRDPNDIYTFYYFPSHFHNFIQEQISDIFHHYDIKCYFPQSCESAPFKDYLYFDENLFPPGLLEMFMNNLYSNQDILEIKPNIFNGKEIVTVLIVKKGTEKSIIQFVRNYLLQQKVLFKTFLYPLQYNITINEKMIFKERNDFYAILEEIKKFNSKIINVQRDILYLYEFHPLRKLFQKFSFICFQNEIEKMEALNYINQIIFKKMNKKFVEYDIECFYASINEHSYPIFIQQLIPDLLNHFKGFKDLQRNVVSIESPVERTYIGFDTFHHLKKCHLKLINKIKILTICPKSKLFWKKKGLNYLEIKHSFNFKINYVIDLVSKIASDVQENCSELSDDESHLICISYIGFSSNETFANAKKVLEVTSFAQNNDISINEYYERKYSFNIDEPRESYLFYDSL